MKRYALPSLVTALALASLNCGTSGGSEARPIEILYYVSGGPNLPFVFADTPDLAGCGSSGTGIQSPNSNHQFGDRVFQTPHLFVLENAHQPVRAVIRNISNQPIQVDMYLGFTQQVGGDNGVIQPGACRTIASAPGTFTIKQLGPEIRTEVCSPTAGLSTSCLDQPPPTDRNIAFFGSTGDLVATNITNCQLNPFLDACRTPATFFWQNPQDQFDAVMSVNSGQNPDGQPKATIRSELYVNGNLSQSATGTEPIVGVNL
ncbi:hypothetical protein KF840_22290 [bacterium]|nr:hypothetical protein [bacterium]